MGKKNRNKNKNKNKKGGGSAKLAAKKEKFTTALLTTPQPAIAQGHAHLQGDEDAIPPTDNSNYDEPMITRAMPLDLAAHADDNYRRLCLNLPESNRSATSERFAKAFRLHEELENWCFANEEEASRDWGLDATLDNMVTDDAFVKNCAKVVECFLLGDSRIAFSRHVVRLVLNRSKIISGYVTELYHISENEIQLDNVGARGFVVLLATAICFSKVTLDSVALHVAHELRAHAAFKYDWLNWKDLDETTAPLKEADLRFMLGIIGVRAALAMYRHREERQAHSWSEKVSSAFLLDSIETFGKDLLEFRPEHPMGYWVFGYLAKQSVAKRAWHGLRGAAECLIQMKKCIKAADSLDDDFYKAIGRIEVALCLCLGGEGVVSYELPISGECAHVRRKLHITAEEQRSNPPQVPFHASAATTAAVEECMRREWSRLERGVPNTTLEPDEYLLVPCWAVLRYWNEAMVIYDALKVWDHHFFVASEARGGWHAVSKFLSQTKSHLLMGGYDLALNNGQGFDKERDKGCRMCFVCHKTEREVTLMLCAKCRRVDYCSRECQVKDWDLGHKVLCKAFRSKPK